MTRPRPNGRLFRVLLAAATAVALIVALGPKVNPFAGTPAGAVTCPCSIWASTATPATVSDPDTAAVELGTKFRADVDGFVTGVRYYKGTANTGSHVGHLWTNAGANLGTVTFTGETASGWQQATFASPIAVSANTTYIVSYY